MTKPRITLKAKLLLLLTLVSSAVLTGYAYEMLQDFRRDKQVYVFDTALLHARGLAGLIGVEVENGLRQTRAVFNYFSKERRQFLPQAQARLREEGNIEGVEVYAAGDEPKLVAAVYRDPAAFRESGISPRGGLQIERWSGRPEGWALAAPVKTETGAELVAVTYFTKGSFLSAFRDTKVLNNFLIGGGSSLVLEPPEGARAVTGAAIQSALSTIDQRRGLDSGVFEARAPDSEGLLVSYAAVGAGDLKVVSAVPVGQAMQTAQLVVKKSWYFWLMLIFLSVFVAVLGAAGVTSNLKRLHSAVGRVSQGDLDVSIPPGGGDEIGDLSRGFNQMTARIRALIQETAVKTRMEEELKTAQLLQNTIFPPARAEAGRVKLRGSYTPANECSGDWWVHSLSGDLLYVGIADATGHGAPAALVTSAARSAYSVLARMPGLGVAEWLAGLNRATYDTAQSKMQMTAVLTSVNCVTGETRFAVASHEPVCILRAKGRPLGRLDLEFPQCAPGYRLGDKPDSAYEEGATRLEPGDMLFFYTDGLTEMRNPAGDMLGERRVHQKLIEAFNRGAGVDEIVAAMEQLGRDHRGLAELEDDVTFIVVAFGGPA